jgi:hypothetical protein
LAPAGLLAKLVGFATALTAAAQVLEEPMRDLLNFVIGHH